MFNIHCCFYSQVCTYGDQNNTKLLQLKSKLKMLCFQSMACFFVEAYKSNVRIAIYSAE